MQVDAVTSKQDQARHAAHWHNIMSRENVRVAPWIGIGATRDESEDRPLPPRPVRHGKRFTERQAAQFRQYVVRLFDSGMRATDIADATGESKELISYYLRTAGRSGNTQKREKSQKRARRVLRYAANTYPTPDIPTIAKRCRISVGTVIRIIAASEYGSIVNIRRSFLKAVADEYARRDYCTLAELADAFGMPVMSAFRALRANGIASHRERCRHRNARIVRERRNGASIAELADRFRLTQSRISQITRYHKPLSSKPQGGNKDEHGHEDTQRQDTPAVREIPEGGEGTVRPAGGA